MAGLAARAAARSVSSAAARPKNVLSIQSHVVYGAAGNSAAVFPMRRLGVNVWPLNTVQFSNHTQYGAWEGLPTPNEQISALVRGIEERGVLGSCDAVLSGYLGSAEQGGHVLDVVRRVRNVNPSALYLCDPVMGHPEKGCVVPAGVQAFHTEQSCTSADVICPNVLELSILAARPVNTMSDVIDAARSLLARGPGMVLIKHLAHAGRSPAEFFEMLLVMSEDVWHVATPLLPFARPPVGVGDLTSGLFLVKLLQGATPLEALEHTAGAYHAVMQATFDAGEYELQLVAAQHEIAVPSNTFKAQRIT